MAQKVSRLCTLISQAASGCKVDDQLIAALGFLRHAVARDAAVVGALVDALPPFVKVLEGLAARKPYNESDSRLLTTAAEVLTGVVDHGADIPGRQAAALVRVFGSVAAFWCTELIASCASGAAAAAAPAVAGSGDLPSGLASAVRMQLDRLLPLFDCVAALASHRLLRATPGLSAWIARTPGVGGAGAAAVEQCLRGLGLRDGVQSGIGLCTDEGEEHEDYADDSDDDDEDEADDDEDDDAPRAPHRAAAAAITTAPAAAPPAAAAASHLWRKRFASLDNAAAIAAGLCALLAPVCTCLRATLAASPDLRPADTILQCSWRIAVFASQCALLAAPTAADGTPAACESAALLLLRDATHASMLTAASLARKLPASQDLVEGCIANARDALAYLCFRARASTAAAAASAGEGRMSPALPDSAAVAATLLSASHAAFAFSPAVNATLKAWHAAVTAASSSSSGLGGSAVGGAGTGAGGKKLRRPKSGIGGWSPAADDGSAPLFVTAGVSSRSGKAIVASVGDALLAACVHALAARTLALAAAHHGDTATDGVSPPVDVAALRAAFLRPTALVLAAAAVSDASLPPSDTAVAASAAAAAAAAAAATGATSADADPVAAAAAALQAPSASAMAVAAPASCAAIAGAPSAHTLAQEPSAGVPKEHAAEWDFYRRLSAAAIAASETAATAGVAVASAAAPAASGTATAELPNVYACALATMPFAVFKAALSPAPPAATAGDAATGDVLSAAALHVSSITAKSPAFLAAAFEIVAVSALCATGGRSCLPVVSCLQSLLPDVWSPLSAGALQLDRYSSTMRVMLLLALQRVLHTTLAVGSAAAAGGDAAAVAPAVASMVARLALPAVTEALTAQSLSPAAAAEASASGRPMPSSAEAAQDAQSAVFLCLDALSIAARLEALQQWASPMAGDATAAGAAAPSGPSGDVASVVSTAVLGHLSQWVLEGLVELRGLTVEEDGTVNAGSTTAGMKGKGATGGSGRAGGGGGSGTDDDDYSSGSEDEEEEAGHDQLSSTTTRAAAALLRLRTTQRALAASSPAAARAVAHPPLDAKLRGALVASLATPVVFEDDEVLNRVAKLMLDGEPPAER